MVLTHMYSSYLISFVVLTKIYLTDLEINALTLIKRICLLKDLNDIKYGFVENCMQATPYHPEKQHIEHLKMEFYMHIDNCA